MKTFSSMLVCLLITIAGFAQRNVEKTERVSANETIELDLQFADDIKVMQWNKNEIQIKATVMIDDGEGNDALQLKTDKIGGAIIIKSDFGDYFENKWSDKNRKNCNSTTDIDYTVYVPQNTKLKVKSISGSLYADAFSGALTTDLISGDVEIKKYNGDLKLKTISGSLDITMKKGTVDAQTLTGTIYSDLEISQEAKKQRSHGHNRIKGTVNNGSDLVQLETISGNIYMRKG